MRKIFIHHNGALGDVLLSLPAIQALKGQGYQIHLAGRQDIVNFLRDFGCISAGLRSDDPLFLTLHTEKADRDVTEYLSCFDRIYVFTREEDSELAANIRLLFAGARSIRTVPPAGLRRHVSAYRLEQVRPDAKVANYPLLAVPSNYREMARAALQSGGYGFKDHLIAIHPGSGSRNKCWPMDRFIELMKSIKTQISCFFVLFSGPVEDGKLREEIEGCAEDLGKDCLYISDAGLGTVASLLSLCSLYIGNDSGVTHLASSVMSSKVISIFGPTDPVLWAPKSDRCVVVAAGDECSPCDGSLRNSKECGTKCLRDLPAGRVLNLVRFAF